MLSNMQVFNQYLMPVLTEMYPQEIEKFNAASNGTILLTAANFDGDFMERSFYNALHSSQRRVDRYAANGAQAGTNLTQNKDVSVKVAGGFGPIVYEPSQMSWLQKPTQEGITVAARYFAEALMADQLNTAIASLVAAISNQPTATNDVSGGTDVPVTQGEINNGLALFGDRSRSIRALVMTGSQYHKLVGQAIANSNNLFEIGGIAVSQGTAFGQGRPIIVTDSPSLFAGSLQRVLGLQAGAAQIGNSGDIVTNVQDNNGKDRIETTFQADYSFTVGLLGYAWDEVNGGKSPSDADLSTGSNWDLVMSSIKDTAGVIIIGDDV